MSDQPVRWLAAPPDWDADQPNPFVADGAYGAGWSCFAVSGVDDDQIRNGRRPRALYVAVLGRGCPDLLERLGDFLAYEAAHGRRVIVRAPAGVCAEEFVAQALAQVPPPLTPRPGDPRWLVHSTTCEAWAAIERCGELRSAASLARAGPMDTVLGELLLGDPPDYAEHVALGGIERLGSEFVVACRQAGKMLPSPDTEYAAGVRLYFDAHQIIRDGLAVRDGLHVLKVRDRLPLDPYLVTRITTEDVPPLNAGERWTTTLFLQRANEVFAARTKLS